MTAVPIPADSDTGARPPAPGARTAGLGATVSAVAVRTLRKYMRSPQLLVTTIVGGAVFLVLFRYIFGGAIRFGTVPYVDFLIPGMVMTSVLITGTGTAVGVAEDRDQGFSDRLRSLPAPASRCWPGGRSATPASWRSGGLRSPQRSDSRSASGYTARPARRSLRSGCASRAASRSCGSSSASVWYRVTPRPHKVLRCSPTPSSSYRAPTFA